VAVWVVSGRAEDPAVVRRRERLLGDLPTGVDLLASCLDAGSAPESSLVVVSRALGGPVGEEFLAIHHRLEVGVDPVRVWRAVAAHDELGPLGRAVGRAHETGAPVGRAVHQLADELRERARADVEARARSIEVKAAAPLGLCLLPAFVVLGVVPMVVGVFSAMRLFR
jgi:Flp pilus assembly protein TadB